MAKTVALVACVSKKHSSPMPAAQLYRSDWFSKASAYAQSVASEWCILSAKYGLLPPERVIEPYNETLNTMPVASRRAWANRALSELRPILKPGDRVVVLAGTRYREHLVPYLRSMGCQVEIPMEGLRIGEQLSWLNRQLKK